MQVRARNFLLVHLDQDVLPHRFLKQVIALALGAVAPKNIFRLGGSSTSCTQSSTAWFAGLLLPIPDGGEMAGAMFFINKMSIPVESSRSRISSGSGGS